MPPHLTHLLNRTTLIRRLLEQERDRSSGRPSRRLRLQALLLRAQRRLADHAAAIAGRGAAVARG